MFIGGQRPPLQLPIWKTTLKLQIHAVATGACLRAYTAQAGWTSKMKINKYHPIGDIYLFKMLILLIKMHIYVLNQKSKEL